MSKPSQSPLAGGRPLAGPAGGGLRGGPSLSPLPPKGERGGRWLLWLILIPLLLLGLTYLLGRTVEPIRAKLEKVPLAGPLLFKEKVWPILWNKPAAKPEDKAASTPGATSSSGTTPSGTTPAKGTAPAAGSTGTGIDPKLLEEAAGRLAAAETKEAELKRKEADLKARENALKDLEAKLNKAVSETEALKVQLQGQLENEQHKVEIVRNMGRTQQAAFFEGLTDDEVITILKYMTPEELGKILGSMNPYRAARIFEKLPTLGKPPATP